MSHSPATRRLFTWFEVSIITNIFTLSPSFLIAIAFFKIVFVVVTFAFPPRLADSIASDSRRLPDVRQFDGSPLVTTTHSVSICGTSLILRLFILKGIRDRFNNVLATW